MDGDAVVVGDLLLSRDSNWLIRDRSDLTSNSSCDSRDSTREDATEGKAKGAAKTPIKTSMPITIQIRGLSMAHRSPHG